LSLAWALISQHVLSL